MKSGFEAATRDDWLAEASRSLKGRAVSGLGSLTADGIRIDPLYARTDNPLAVPAAPSSPPPVLPLVIETEPDAANRAILDELIGGAAGAVLQMASPGQPGLAMTPKALNAALAGVDPDAAELHLAPGDADWPEAVEVFRALLNEHGATASSISLGADPVGAAMNSGSRIVPAHLALVARLAASHAGTPAATLFSASGVPAHEAGATEAQELAAMLTSGVAYLRALEDAGHSPQTVAPRIGLELSTDTDVFVSIAKLRAARLLWLRIGELCGGLPRPRLHVRTSARMMARRDVHVNMVRTTIASLAAALGGADTLTVLPFTHALGRPTGSARRIARNQMIILAQEAYIGTVADPGFGSGYIEHLTRELAARAWGLFQDIESAGGGASPAGVERLAALVGKARQAREAQIASGQRRIVGVNIYENSDDQPPVVEPWPA